MEGKVILEPPDFSLVVGGPLYQLFRKAHLSGAGLEFEGRRVLVIALTAWLPLLVLSILEGHAIRGIKIPFLYDVEAHVRFLVALPILVGSEVLVHSRIRLAPKRFLERGIVIEEDVPKFKRAIDAGMRIRNSVLVEIVLILVVYSLGLYLRRQIATSVPSWYSNGGLGWNLTKAGYWYEFISIPIFQFILLRWYLRLFIWFQFLWRVSRLNLNLIATHPDRAEGLGFLGNVSYAFGPILFAQGTLLAGLIASRVLYDGKDLMSFKMEALGMVGFFMALILSPLLVFTPKMAKAKRQALSDYGKLGSQYVQDFDGKWIRGGAGNEELLGSADIQSLADLGNSFSVIAETRLVPFGWKDMTRLAIATAAPLIPLSLTVISFEELVTRLLKIII